MSADNRGPDHPERPFHERVKEVFDQASPAGSEPVNGAAKSEGTVSSRFGQSDPKRRKELRRGLGYVVLVMIGIWLGGYPAMWLFPSSEWAIQWRYALVPDLDGAIITATPLPHDCEFLTAPLGSKHCHYEKTVFTVRIRSRDSRRLVSYDDGKTWSPAETTDKRAVFVAWNKVED